MLGGESNHANEEDEEEKEFNKGMKNKILAVKLAELEGFKKAYIEKLAYLSTIE